MQWASIQLRMGSTQLATFERLNPPIFPTESFPRREACCGKKFQGLKGLNSRGALLLSRILHVLLDEILQDVEEGKTSSRKEMPQSHP